MTVPHVRLHLWQVPPKRVPNALGRMASHRVALGQQLRRPGGPLFAKLLGTARASTFTPRDSDLLHWALVTTWRTANDADAFEDGTIARSWALIADESARLALTPIASRGRWSGREPFGNDFADGRHLGPVAAITRARVKASRLTDFWQQSAHVANDLADADGLIVATGIGEAPVGLQGTFSLWADTSSMNAFAHHSPRHLEAMARTPIDGWYAEELFARFSVDSANGTFAGIDLADAISEHSEGAR